MTHLLLPLLFLCQLQDSDERVPFRLVNRWDLKLPVRGFKVSRDSKHFAIIDDSQIATAFRYDGGPLKSARFAGPRFAYDDFAFSSCGKFAVWGSQYDAAAHVIDLENGKTVYELGGHYTLDFWKAQVGVCCVCFAHARNQVWLIGPRGQVFQWRLDQKGSTRTVIWNGAYLLAKMNKTESFVVMDSDCHLHRLEPSGDTALISKIPWSRHRVTMLVAPDDKSLLIWSGSSLREIDIVERKQVRLHEIKSSSTDEHERIYACQYSQDGQKIIVLTRDEILSVDRKRNTVRSELVDFDGIAGFSLLDRHALLTVTATGVLKLWAAKSDR